MGHFLSFEPLVEIASRKKEIATKLNRAPFLFRLSTCTFLSVCVSMRCPAVSVAVPVVTSVGVCM